MNLHEVSRELERISKLLDDCRFRQAREAYLAILARGLEPAAEALVQLALGIFYWSKLGFGSEAREAFHSAHRLATTAQSPHVNLRTVAAHAAENAMLLSLSHEEYEEWAGRLERLAPREQILHEQRPMVAEMLGAGQPWYRVMMTIAGGYFHVDPARDPGLHAAAVAILELILLHRRELRPPRAEHCAIAGTYAALVVKVWAACGEYQIRRFGVADPDDFKFVFDPAIPLLEEAVEIHAGEPHLAQALDMLRQSQAVTKESACRPPTAGDRGGPGAWRSGRSR